MKRTIIISLLMLIVASITILSCNPKAKEPTTTEVKPDKPKVEKKTMSNDQFQTEYGFDITPLVISDEQKNEVAKGKPVKIEIVVWANGLSLTKAGTIYTTTLPANPRHVGFQNLTNMTSPYYCRWYLPTGMEKTCTEAELGVGTKRTFATITTSNDVFISNTSD